ncbi:hypothetical protein FOZ62_008420 [Perkinsus olseni]|uniref:GB1/RHD3-type G domain-containing protein n=1 Tax=Perkinsus olseni TaxID=32597 RepID=A0A7J6RJD2_PEROL|nr:hypothetical protein FOZ62_008420 [Perkinsus olseni]
MDVDSLSSHSSDITLVIDQPLGASCSQPVWRKGEPMQLLSLAQGEGGGERVTVCPEARDYFLRSVGNRPVAVAVVCGLYRTGKSYLLNLLSNNTPSGEEDGDTATDGDQHQQGDFTVGSTVNACTSGIWMWASSSGGSDNGPVYILLDCEGSGNVEHDRDHDSILFALGTLLSGYFIYNSKGVIDEGAIQTLSVVTSLAQHIQSAQHQEGSDGSPSVVATAPHFLWVLRDFVLALEDQNGRPISAQEYLEIALSDKSSVAAYRSQESRDCREKLCKKRIDVVEIRRDDYVSMSMAEVAWSYGQSMLSLFTHRDCIALVTPVIDEEKLQALDTVPYRQLRGEFRDQIELMKRKVFRDCTPKTINGVPVTGVTFARLLDQYIHSINSKEVPRVGSVWQALQAQEGERVVGECSDEYRAVVRNRVEPLLPTSEVDLAAELKALRQEVYAQFKRESLGERKIISQYREQLKDLMDDLDNKVTERNEAMARESCVRLLKRLWQPVAERLDAYDDTEGYSLDDGISEFTRDLSELRESYQKEARGPTAVVMETYSKWITPKQEQGLVKLTRRQQEAAAQRAVMMERERAMEEERQRAERELEERRAREQQEREVKYSISEAVAHRSVQEYRIERTEKMRLDVKELTDNIDGIDTPSLVEEEETDESQRRMTDDIQAEITELRTALDDRDRKGRGRRPTSSPTAAAAACCRCTIM